MATLTVNYSAAISIAITAVTTTLAADQWASGAIVDNTSNKYVDALVGGFLEIGTTTPAAGDTVDIYVFGNYDTAVGTDLTGGIDALFAGADQEEVPGTDFMQENVYLLTSVAIEANEGYHWGPLAVSGAFGGVLPPKWGILFHNNTGAAMAAGSTLNYIGIKFDSA